MERKRIFENVLIIKGEFTEKQYKKSLEEIQKHIESLEIKKLEEKGKKRLAYPVDENKEGYFVVMEIKTTEEEILKIEQYYRVNSDILKFLTVKKEKNRRWKERRKNQMYLIIIQIIILVIIASRGR